MEKEKEKIIIELLKQTETYSQIEQQLHVSSRDISRTKKNYEEEQKKLEEEQKKDEISKLSEPLKLSSRALKLFEQGNSPVQVAVELDIVTQEAGRLYKEYWKLKGLYALNDVYAELRGNIFSRSDLCHLTKKIGMAPHQVIDALKIAQEIPNLEAERRYIEDVIDEDTRRIFELKRQKVSLANELNSMLEELQSFREYRDNKLNSFREYRDEENSSKSNLFKNHNHN